MSEQIFPYGPKSRLIRALLYTFTNKIAYDEILLSSSIIYCVSVLPSPYASSYAYVLPDCMLICKMPESDWLDYGARTIYTFPYRWSRPFIWLSVKVKTQDFWKDGREAIDRGRERLVTFGKLSANFRKFSGKT